MEYLGLRISDAASPSGARGYHVDDVTRLLDVSKATIAKRITEGRFTRLSGRRALIAVEEVDKERAAFLSRIGAAEPTEAERRMPADLEAERDALLGRVLTLEHKLRLVLAARSKRRERDQAAQGEEEALDEAILIDLSPPQPS